MNTIEEGWAFRYHVREYGWGRVSELARLYQRILVMFLDE